MKGNGNGNGDNPCDITSLRSECIGLAFEHFFIGEAILHGLYVSHTGGLNPGFDVRIGAERESLRVQVKGTLTLTSGGTYRINIYTAGGRKYEKDAFDILAAHVLPLRLWWIIPFDELYDPHRRKQVSGFTVMPNGNCRQFYKYKDAWGLLGAINSEKVSDTDLPKILQYTQYNTPKSTSQAYLNEGA